MSTIDKIGTIFLTLSLCAVFFLLGESEYSSKIGDTESNRIMGMVMQVSSVVIAVSCIGFIFYLDRYDKADKKAEVNSSKKVNVVGFMNLEEKPKPKVRPGYFVTDSRSHQVVSPIFWSGGRPADERWKSEIREIYSGMNGYDPVDIYFFDTDYDSLNNYEFVMSDVIEKQEVYANEEYAKSHFKELV